MDAYAVKGLGGALMADVAGGQATLRAELPSITCPTTVIVGEHDHPLVDQAPELAAGVAEGRLSVISGRLPLAAADPRPSSGRRPSRPISTWAAATRSGQ